MITVLPRYTDWKLCQVASPKLKTLGIEHAVITNIGIGVEIKLDRNPSSSYLCFGGWVFKYALCWTSLGHRCAVAARWRKQSLSSTCHDIRSQHGTKKSTF